MPTPNKLILPNKDISLTYWKKIDMLCKSLEKFGVTFFNYLKVYRNGNIVDLNNTPEMHESFYYKTTLYQDFELINPSYKPEQQFLLFQCLPNNFYTLMRDKFDIDNILAFIVAQKDCTEYWQFGSAAGNHNILNFYVNNTELIKQFSLTFVEEAKTIIGLAEKNRFKLLLNQKEFATLPQLDNSDPVDILLQKFQLMQNDFTKLTLRERECLKLCVQGLSATEIALSLDRSKRTIEKHIENIRIKFGYHKLSHLIAKINLSSTDQA